MNFSEAYEETCSKIGLLARYGKYHFLKKSLLQGDLFDVADNRGWFPIHEAAANGKISCLSLLDRSQIDKTTYDGHTPIHLAIKNGHLKCVRLLLKHGVNINIKNDEDKHPLYTAIFNNHESIVNFLLQHNCIDTCILSACLLDAIEIGNEKLSILLVNNCVNIKTQDEFGRNALFIAAEKGHLSILKCLLTKVNFKGDMINTQSFDGATPIFIASQNGNKNCLDLLLKHGGDPNICCKDLSLPLHIACEKGYVDCILALAPPVTKIDSWENKGVNVFEISIGHGKIESILALLDFTQNIDELFDKSWLIDAVTSVPEVNLHTSSLILRDVSNYFNIISFAIYVQAWNIVDVLLRFSSKIFCRNDYFNYNREVINISSAMLLSNYQPNITPVYTLLWKALIKKLDRTTIKEQFYIKPIYVDMMMQYYPDLRVLLEFIKLNLVDPKENLFDFSLNQKHVSINSYIDLKINPSRLEGSQEFTNYIDGSTKRLTSFYFESLQYTAQVISCKMAKCLEEKYQLDFNIYARPRSLKHLCRIAIRRKFRISYPYKPLELVLSRFKTLPEYFKNYISFDN